MKKVLSLLVAIAVSTVLLGCEAGKTVKTTKTDAPKTTDVKTGEKTAETPAVPAKTDDKTKT
jgi:hypothetical protein